MSRGQPGQAGAELDAARGEGSGGWDGARQSRVIDRVRTASGESALKRQESRY